MATIELHIPYRSGPLDHQGFRCRVLLVVEKEILVCILVSVIAQSLGQERRWLTSRALKIIGVC
jgi:hypothetical protein